MHLALWSNEAALLVAKHFVTPTTQSEMAGIRCMKDEHTELKLLFAKLHFLLLQSTSQGFAGVLHNGFTHSSVIRNIRSPSHPLAAEVITQRRRAAVPAALPATAAAPG